MGLSNTFVFGEKFVQAGIFYPRKPVPQATGFEANIYKKAGMQLLAALPKKGPAAIGAHQK